MPASARFTEVLVVSVTQQAKDAVVRIAQERGVSQGQVVREMLDRGLHGLLETKEPRQP